jgi:hypothetical protein
MDQVLLAEKRVLIVLSRRDSNVEEIGAIGLIARPQNVNISECMPKHMGTKSIVKREVRCLASIQLDPLL